MNARKLIVGAVSAMTLTLFAGAMYAQQLSVPQEDTAQTSIARHEEGVRPGAQATLIDIREGAVAQLRGAGHRAAEPPGLHRESRTTRDEERYADASAFEGGESSFGRRSHEAHQAGRRTPEHARSHR